MTENNIFLALDSLFTRYVNLCRDGNLWPVATFDPPWPSPCIIQDEKPDDSESVYWKPVERKQFELFKNLEEGFGFAFPEALAVYYGSFWSNGICVQHQDLDFNLIQIWNEEDEEQLSENMLGHVFAKIKNKQPVSFFIGCTDGNDVITLEKDSGHVVLEKPGYQGHQTLSSSLETFLLQLTPSTDSY